MFIVTSPQVAKLRSRIYLTIILPAAAFAARNIVQLESPVFAEYIYRCIFVLSFTAPQILIYILYV